MTPIRLAAALAILALPVAALSAAAPAKAASAHNSQAGGIGDSQNPTDSTVNSRRVKHRVKHKHM